MAQPTTIKGGKVSVKLGDGASPEVFSSPCGLTQRGLTLTKNLNEVILPDCDDPDSVDWVGRDAASLSMSISGQGVLASESVEAWMDAAESIDSINVKLEIVFPAKTYTYTGRMHVESFEIGANNGEQQSRSACSLTARWSALARKVAPND